MHGEPRLDQRGLARGLVADQQHAAPLLVSGAGVRQRAGELGEQRLAADQRVRRRRRGEPAARGVERGVGLALALGLGERALALGLRERRGRELELERLEAGLGPGREPAPAVEIERERGG